MVTLGFIFLWHNRHEKTVFDVILEKGFDDYWGEVVEFYAAKFKWPDIALYKDVFFKSWFCKIFLLGFETWADSNIYFSIPDNPVSQKPSMTMAKHLSIIKMEIRLLENMLTVNSHEEASGSSASPAANSWLRVVGAKKGMQVLKLDGNVRVVEKLLLEVLLAPYCTNLKNRFWGGRRQYPTLCQYHWVSGGGFIKWNIASISLRSGLIPMYRMRQWVQLCKLALK